MINVLILSAGRRVELIERFRRAKEQLNIDGTIVAVDISASAPAVHFADTYYLIPRIDAPDYIDAVIDVCRRERISLIVPTIDTELLKLSDYREQIESLTGAKLLLSRPEVIRICRDKNNTQAFFTRNGFGVPHQLTQREIAQGDYSFPLFIKPKDGSSSINAFKVENEEQLEFFLRYVKEPMVQEFMVGTEYSVDVFCDFDSRPITIVPRVRVAVRGGEIAKGIVQKDRDIINDVTRLLDVLKPIGPITVQCMKTDRGVQYIEINPRFGGGAPMSIDAGADSCANLYRLLSGEQLCYNEDYADGRMFVRFDSSIMLDENMERLL